jgi:hypothetical protein
LYCYNRCNRKTLLQARRQIFGGESNFPKRLLGKGKIREKQTDVSLLRLAKQRLHVLRKITALAWANRPMATNQN